MVYRQMLCGHGACIAAVAAWQHFCGTSKLVTLSCLRLHSFTLHMQPQRSTLSVGCEHLLYMDPQILYPASCSWLDILISMAEYPLQCSRSTQGRDAVNFIGKDGRFSKSDAEESLRAAIRTRDPGNHRKVFENQVRDACMHPAANLAIAANQGLSCSIAPYAVILPLATRCEQLRATSSDRSALQPLSRERHSVRCCMLAAAPLRDAAVPPLCR